MSEPIAINKTKIKFLKFNNLIKKNKGLKNRNLTRNILLSPSLPLPLFFYHLWRKKLSHPKKNHSPIFYYKEKKWNRHKKKTKSNNNMSQKKLLNKERDLIVKRSQF